MTAFRASRILAAYQFRDGIRRHTASVGNTKRLKSDEPDQEFREEALLYLRDIGRQMQNEIGEQTRLGDAETYDRDRKPTTGSRYHGKGRNGHRGTSSYRNSRNYRWVNNCAERGEEEVGGGGDFDGNWDTSYSHRDRPLSQVNYTGVILPKVN